MRLLDGDPAELQGSNSGAMARASLMLFIKQPKCKCGAFAIRFCHKSLSVEVVKTTEDIR